MPDVSRAFKTVAEVVEKGDRLNVRSAENSTRARLRLVNQEAREKIRAMQTADREHKRALEAGKRFAERMSREEVRAFDAAERAKNQSAAKWMRQRENEERASFRRREQFAKTLTGAAGRAFSTVGGGVARVAAGVLQVGGGYSVADSVQRNLSLRGSLADIANRGVIPGDPANAKRRSVDELRGTVMASAIRFGIDPDKGAAGLDKFASKTGHLTRGMELLPGLAEMSRAGAGSLDDLSDAAGDVFNADKTQNAEQVLEIMRALAAQGKIGAVEMKDLASQMAKLGAAAGRFEGDAAHNIGMMGGLAQLARESGGAANAQQATTSVQSLTNQFYKNARVGAFAKLGVQTKDEKTGFNRDIDKVLIEAMLAAERKSRESGHGMRDFDVIMGTTIADAQARRATSPLERAFKKAGGGQAGAQAVEDLLKKFGGATMKPEEVREAAAERMKETDAKLEIAMIQLRNTTAEKLTPALLRMVPLLEQSVPVLARFLEGVIAIGEWLAKNPFSGMSAIIVALITKEIAAAQIGTLIRSLIAGGGGVGGAPGVGTPGVSAGAGGLLAVGSALQIGSAANLADETTGAVASGQASAAQLQADLKSGDPNRVAAARKAIEQAKAQSSTVDVASAYIDRATRAASIMTGPFGYLGMKAGDFATEGLGFKSNSQRSVETLKANEIVNTPELQKAVTQAFVQGIRDGAKIAPPTTDPSNRGEPITVRTAK